MTRTSQRRENKKVAKPNQMGERKIGQNKPKERDKENTGQFQSKERHKISAKTSPRRERTNR